MLENVTFNVPAAIIFALAVAGIIALAVYKRKRNEESFSMDKFLNDNYYNLVDALSDVIQILLIDIKDYPDKESYEKDIIRVTINKLDENCSEFGINPVVFKLVDKETLTQLLYNILNHEKFSLFLNAVPNEVIIDNKQLYDDEVVYEAIADDDYKHLNDTDETAATDETEAVEELTDTVTPAEESHVEAAEDVTDASTEETSDASTETTEEPHNEE